MTGKFTLSLATIAVLTAIPQIAHASCSGNACSAFSVDGKNFSSSDKRAKAVLTNKDSAKKIHIKGCITSDGKCNTGDSFETTIDPGKNVPISGPGTDKFIVDVTSAEFITPPPAGLPSLTKTDTGCSLKDYGANGCPPKSDWAQIKQKGDDAYAALTAAGSDLNALDPKNKDKTRLNGIMQRISQAMTTIAFVEGLFGKEKSTAPAENIDYMTKLEKKKVDVVEVFKAKATAIFGCVPKIDTSSVSCEGVTDVGGGRK